MGIVLGEYLSESLKTDELLQMKESLLLGTGRYVRW